MAIPEDRTDRDAVGAEARSASNPAQRASEELVQAARDEAGELGRHARETAEDLKHGAREVADQVKEQAYSTADTQKEAAAQQIDGWAHALKTASDDLRDRGQESAATWVRQAAAGLERASGTMRARDIDDLVGTVEDFARRQPVAFLGGAVVAGFGLARLMKSSADRRRGSGYGEGTGTAAERRFGEGAGTHYGEGGGL